MSGNAFCRRITDNHLYNSMSTLNCSVQGRDVVVNLKAGRFLDDVDGSVKQIPTVISFTREQLNKGLAVFGLPGSGKTKSVLFKAGEQIKKSLCHDDKMIVLDVKGEYTDLLDDKDTIIIGHDSYKNIWNIYNDIMAFGKSSIETRAGDVVEYLFMGQVVLNEPFWVNAAKIVVRKILIYHIRQALETGNRKELNNAALNNFLSSLNVDSLLNMINTYQDFSELKMLLCINEDNSYDKTLLGIISEIVVMRNRIFQGAFKEKGDFSIIDFVLHGSGTVILQTDMSVIEFFKGIFTYLIDVSFSAIASPMLDTGNIYYLIDEFGVIEKMRKLDMAVALLRTNKVSVIVAAQNVDQIERTYNKGEDKQANVVMNAFQNIIIMNSPESTANFAKGHFGTKEAEIEFTKPNGNIGKRSEQRPAVELNDVISLDVGEAYVKYSNKPVFKVKFDL